MPVTELGREGQLRPHTTLVSDHMASLRSLWHCCSAHVSLGSLRHCWSSCLTTRHCHSEHLPRHGRARTRRATPQLQRTDDPAHRPHCYRLPSPSLSPATVYPPHPCPLLLSVSPVTNGVVCSTSMCISYVEPLFFQVPRSRHDVSMYMLILCQP